MLPGFGGDDDVLHSDSGVIYVGFGVIGVGLVLLVLVVLVMDLGLFLLILLVLAMKTPM